MQPGELATRTEQAEKRWDARVGRAMDVAVPHELSTKAQWDLVRGFGLQLRDTYGVALCVSLHRPNAKGDDRNVHGHIFMTTRAVDADGNFSKAKSGSNTPVVSIQIPTSDRRDGCVWNRTLSITEIDLLEIVPGRGLHVRTREESWLVFLPVELQSDELLKCHHFRGGQLLVGLLRTLRVLIRILEIEQQQQ
jgi:hypothetical protein